MNLSHTSRKKISAIEIGKFNYIKYIYLIFFVHILCFSLSLINDAIYFDDYVLVPVVASPLSVIDAWASGGYFIYTSGFLHAQIFQFFDNSLDAILCERFIIFAIFLLVSCLFFLILTELRGWTNQDRIFIALFFAAFPVNFVRLQLNLLMYSISYLFYFIALYLLISRMQLRFNLLRVLILCLFFLSFSTAAIIPFYGIALIALAYKFWIAPPSLKSFYDFVIGNLDFLFLPIFYFIVKSLFFTQYGLYEGNYEVNFKFLNPAGLATAFVESLLKPISSSIGFDNYLTFLLFLVCSVFLSLIIRMVYSNKKIVIYVTKVRLKQALLCIFAFILGVIAYLSVGKMPSMGQDGLNSSRHQLLIPMAGALFTYLLAISHFKVIKLSSRSVNIGLIVVLIAFINTHFWSNVDALIDGYKQKAIILQLKKDNLVKKSTNVLFLDSTFSSNHHSRHINFYEYSSLMKIAFGDETRLGSNCPYPNYLPSEYELNLAKKAGNYSISHYISSEPQAIVKIQPGKSVFSRYDALALIFTKFYNPEKFEKDIVNNWRLSSVAYNKTIGCKLI